LVATKTSNRNRCLGIKRCVRYSVSVTNETDRKLTKLAKSCEMSKSEMTDVILEIGLRSPELIEKLQDRYNKDERIKLHPVIINNILQY
jgi:hypothetical protein